VYGHESLRQRLGAAIARGRLPQAILFSGPPGVGKQRLALWGAAALFCEAPEPGGEPCGTCGPCRQVAGLNHPDLHWFVPIVLKRKSSDPDKLIEEAERALADTMVERREDSRWSAPENAASHSLASVRLLQRRVSRRPFQGTRKVIIIGDADRLIVQEASQEAANALLKVLEEPPEDTTLMLTSGVPERLLPTIRSRVVPVRVGPVPEAAVRRFLEEVAGASARDASRQAAEAQGRIGELVGASSTSAKARDAAERLLAAIRGGAAGEWAGEALRQPPWGARGGYTDLLEALSRHMRNQLAKRASAGPEKLSKPLQALKIIDSHRTAASGNVNPQLSLAVLARELQELT